MNTLQVLMSGEGEKMSKAQKKLIHQWTWGLQAGIFR